MKFNLTGPMRGIPEYNFPEFNSVEIALVHSDIWRSDGEFQIFNPARNFEGDTTLSSHQYMQVDLEHVLACDVVVLLPGWEKSEGGKVEIKVGVATGKRFMLALPTHSNDLNPVVQWMFKEVDSVPAENLSPRAEVVTTALHLITGDRNNAYGPPTQDFRRTADAMTAYGYRHTQLPANAPDCPTCGARPLQAHDTAIAVDCVKTSRIMWTPTRADSWVDKAGYAGCGYECAVEEDKRKNGGDG